MDRVDVLIVVALKIEFEAAREAALAQPGVALWTSRDYEDCPPYLVGEYINRDGRRWTVALARSTRMGGRTTASVTSQLAERLNPTVVAMCGVCAGNPAITALGDVVVADIVYDYGEGQRTSEGFVGDHRQIPLDGRWLRAAQRLAVSELPSYGAATAQEARIWFLERLNAGQDPRTHPARPRYFPPGTWPSWLGPLEADGLITRSGPGWALTSDGAAWIQRLMYDDVDCPSHLPLAIHVSPMASDSVVATDGITFDRLTSMGVRTIAAVEMESAAVATIARERELEWVIVKGIMDYADDLKDDRYTQFAARVSAEALLRLLADRPGTAPSDRAPVPGRQRKSSSGRAEVTILHLSDLRIGSDRVLGPDGPVEETGGWDLLTSELPDDVRSVTGLTGGGPDLIVVTGDLTESGSRIEFDRARRFLTGLAAALDLSVNRLVVVPGDHDVNRKACQAYFMQCEADDEEPQAPYWRKWQQYTAMVRELYAGIGGVGFDPGRPYTLFEIPELSIVVAGLNSTIAFTHQPEKQFGFCGTEQLAWFAERLHRYRDGNWLRVGAVHHVPFLADWLPAAVDHFPPLGIGQQDRLRDAAAFHKTVVSDIELLLYGSNPTAPAVYVRPDTPAVSTASTYGTAAGLQYQLISRGTQGFVRQIRRRLTGEGRWVSADPDPEHLHGRTRPSPKIDPPGLKRSFGGTSGLEVETALGTLASGRPGEFARRIADLVPLRHADASVAEVVNATGEAPAYLRVRRRDDSFDLVWPVGMSVDGPSPRLVEEFVAVHRRFAQDDPHLQSELVYGGPAAAADDLVTSARRMGIRLMSLVEYQGLLDLRPYTDAQRQRLQIDRDYQRHMYVPQRFHGLSESPERSRRGLLEAVVEWLDSDRSCFGLILADFGHGKTFLLRELTRQLPDLLPHIIPVLVELRSLEKAPTLDELLAMHLTRAEVRRIEPDKLRSMIHTGRIALLFDGFDELVLRVTYPQAAEYLSTLLRPVRAAGSNAKVLVSSRSQHFASEQQIRQALEAGADGKLRGRIEVAVIDGFDPDQILDFLTRVNDGDAERAQRHRDLIAGVEDLLGLATNPRMLAFIAALPDERLDSVRRRHGVISAADLYRELIEYWLEYESGRLKHNQGIPALESDDRMAALNTFALRLWRSGAAGIGLEDLDEDVATTLTNLADLAFTPAQASHAIASGTLLVRRDDDTMGFVHQSVLEWLMANRIAAELAGTRTSELLVTRAMSKLMAEFLADLAGHETATAWARSALAESDATSAAKDNALLLAERLGRGTTIDLTGQDLRGAPMDRNLSGAVLARVNLAGSVLHGTDLARADLSRADLTRAMLVEVDFTGADLTGADLTGARLIDCRLDGVRTTDSRWSRAAILGTVPSDLLDGPELEAASIVGRDREMLVLAAGSSVGGIVTIGPLGIAWVARGQRIEAIDLRSGLVVQVILAESGRVEALAVGDVDGRAVVVSGSDDRTVRVWDAITGTPIGPPFTGHSETVLAVAVGQIRDRTVIVSGGDDGTVRVWDAKSGESIGDPFIANTAGVLSVAVGHIGNQAVIVCGCDDNTVHVRETVSGLLIGHPMAGHTDWVRSVAMGQVGDRIVIVSGGDDRTVRIWDAESRTLLVDPLMGHDNWVRSVALAQVGGRALIVSGGDDGTIRVWDAATGTPVMDPMTGHSGMVRSVAVGRVGGRAVIVSGGGGDQTVRIWDAMTGEPDGGTAVDHRDWVRSVAVGRISGRDVIVSSADEETVRVWDAASGAPAGPPLAGHRDWVRAVAVAQVGDLTLIASGGNDHTVQLWDAVRWVPLGGPLIGHTDSVRTVALGQVGGRAMVASGGEDETVRLWDVASGGAWGGPLIGHAGTVLTVALGQVGDRMIVVSGGFDKVVRRWDAVTGKPIGAPLAGHTDWVRSVTVGHVDGRAVIVSGSDDHTVRRWDAETGAPIGDPLRGHNEWVNSVALGDVDGRATIVSGGDDEMVRVWDAVSGKPIGDPLTGHADTVSAVAIAHVGGRPVVVSGGADRSTRVFDLATGSWLYALLGLTDGWAALYPDGTYYLDGRTAGEFWWSIKLCRFEQGELDPYVPGLRRSAPAPIEFSAPTMADEQRPVGQQRRSVEETEAASGDR